MRRFLALLLGLASGAMVLCSSQAALALGTVDNPQGDEIVKKIMPNAARYRSGFSTAAATTVWYGFLQSSADPNRVHTGGKWDFDQGYDQASDITGTDSSQYWTFLQGPQASDGGFYVLPSQRPFWYFDYGNNINNGDHKLMLSRNGRIHRRTGLAGVWHQDNLTTVPDTVTVSGTPGFSTNLAGSGSAWCGLRNTGDPNAPVDPYTGNRYDSQWQFNDNRGTGTCRSAYPGYAAMWDQLMYRDFSYNSGTPGTISFNYRAELNNAAVGDPSGASWFTPDPFDPGNQVTGATAATEPKDSFEVWVGAPKEDASVYDPVHRYLSDTIEFKNALVDQPAMIFSLTGVSSGASGSLAIPGGKNWSSLRVVFRVKTNRAFDDRVPAASGVGWNSTTGAIVIDGVNVNGDISNFETSAEVKPRYSALDTGAGNVSYSENSPSSSWITTGRPVARYGHIHNLNDLPFADPCGKLFCNISENLLLQSDHEDGHRHHKESQNWSYSPVICLEDSGTPGSRGANQGTTAGFRAGISGTNLQFDLYTGFDDSGAAGVFFWYALRSMAKTSVTAAADKQQIGPKIPSWISATAGFINNNGVPLCLVYDTSPGDLDPFIDFANADSVQVELETQTRCERFAATNCGLTDGTYFDNIRLGFITGAGPAKPTVATGFWHLLNDTFPFNKDITPGTPDFDTTTALVNDALNNGRSAGGEGVIPGDTLVYSSAFAGGDTRMDLVFRIKPGPGNYSTKGDMSSALWKVPSDPGLGTAAAGDGSFWGQYMKQTGETNGEVGSKPTGHTASVWDPQTWNSARMDSAQLQLYPLVTRGVGIPVNDTWQGTYIESDPKGGAEAGGVGSPGALAKEIPNCYLVVQTGPLDQTNLCCSTAKCAGISATYPPVGYPSTPTTTFEGTKILPDGLFTPGTHVSYFVRRSKQSVPLTMENSSPDTSTVTYQPGMLDYFDQLRYDSFDVLPDMWKSTDFDGPGLACILYVDAQDRRGSEPSFVGALDSLGYGNDNGADRGWKKVAGSNDPNNTAGFVPVNLGAMGVAYDKYDIRASESQEGARLGCRIPGGGVDPNVADRQCKQGPTLAMLNQYYHTILYSGGDLDNSSGVFHDGIGTGSEQADDAGMVNQWLDDAGNGNEKALWVSGDGATQDLNSSAGSCATLLGRLGGTFIEDNYYDFTGNVNVTMVWKPQAVTGDKFHSARRYGVFNSCLNVLDIIDRDNTVAGAERAARYEDASDRGAGGVGPYYSSVYRRLDAGAGRYYATLLDGASLDNLRGWGGPLDPGSSPISTIGVNNYARHAWMDDALTAFNICARVNPIIGVGDVPGLSLNFVRGAFPNPAVAGAASVRFTLAQPAKVTIRFYNVAGRLVHEATVEGHVGADNLYRWDGTTASGVKAGTGVYFYRLSAPGIQFQNNSQRMVLLGQAGN